MVITLSRKNRSSRKRAVQTSTSRSWFAAATTRMSASPGAMAVRWRGSARRRRSAAWASRGRSPTSSRKSVPPAAASSCALVVPASARVARESVTNGPACRALHAWIAAARTSFPVPLSPVSKTAASLAAACRAVAIAARIAGFRDSRKGGGSTPAAAEPIPRCSARVLRMRCSSVRIRPPL
jgi:hypothetical protein